MSLLPLDDPLYTSIGNKAHFAAIVSTLSFGVLVAHLVKDETDTLFDAEWKKEGFCVANADVPYWTSHDMCLYVDTASALFLALVFLLLRKTPGMERANELLIPGFIGILAHGLGHGTVGRVMRDEGTMMGEDSDQTGLDMIQGLPLSEAIQLQIPGTLFWLGLIKASGPNMNIFTAIVVSLAAMLGQLFVPKYFFFTYVQNVLMLSYSINQLSRKRNEKDFMYATHAMIVGFPVTMVGWMESTQCTAFVKEKFFGHLVYDGFIPFAFLTWYIVCYLRVTLDDDVPQTLRKKEKDI
ncbi:hypothetical protein ACA910_017556 [Epithemia clementina (nom. ined.)]